MTGHVQDFHLTFTLIMHILMWRQLMTWCKFENVSAISSLQH